jgi:DNA repair protein RadC
MTRRAQLSRTALATARAALWSLHKASPDLGLETGCVAYLDATGELLEASVTAHGDDCSVHQPIGDIIRRALELGAAGVITSHNHPHQRNLRPSGADTYTDRCRREVLRACGLRLFDNLIFATGDHDSCGDWYSFRLCVWPGESRSRNNCQEIAA